MRDRLRVIESIYRYRGSSRTDIARQTNLSRGTVSTIAEELGRAHLIREHDAPDDRPRPRDTGRPSALLSLVPGAAFAIGTDIGHQHVRVAICDLTGELVAEKWSATQVDNAPGETLDSAHDLVKHALDDAALRPERILGAGLAHRSTHRRGQGRRHPAGLARRRAGGPTARPARRRRTTCQRRRHGRPWREGLRRQAQRH